MKGRQLPEPGMQVVTNDGTVLGHVKDVSDATQCFRVDCRHAPDLYIPHNYIQDADKGKLVIRASKDHVSYLGWELRPESY